ncbi:MAG: hypothetical protein ISQ56_06380 [Pseudomonadales bacterium]|nr:hypothetical protein [Pseudomonadales bacterium]
MTENFADKVPTLACRSFRQRLLLDAILWLLCALLSLTVSIAARGQDLTEIELPAPAICFGLRTIVEPEALAVCSALDANLRIRARELAEQWLNSAPNSAAAHYTLAEVLLTVEGNVPRALFHLNQAETNSKIRSFDQMIEVSAEAPFDAKPETPLWHYLTLNQLASVHQLIGNQEDSLRYLDALAEAYGVDVESYKGWPLIKLGRFEEARQSALRVLAAEDVDRFSEAQAWNTLCAVELSEPQENLSAPACDKALELDEAAQSDRQELSTVTLTNAAEVALSRLRVDQAESLIDRATRYPNPSSVSNPWIQKLYLTLAQGRFDDAQSALEQMLIWRNRQDPLIGVSNTAEHFLVSATFLLIAGYTEDAARLAESALNQPDRNGNFSADDAQKDAIAALLTTLAFRADYERQLEHAAAQEWQLRFSSVARAQLTRLAAWRAGRRAASLFANAEIMRDRLRPYAPLDVHIPEWMEPEIAKLLGAGVFDLLIEDAEICGSFRGALGYKHVFETEAAALQEEFDRVISEGMLALSLLPSAEVLLRARVHWHLAHAYWSKGDTLMARSLLSTSLRQDPSLARRLGGNIPVTLSHDGSEFALALASKLAASPRFDATPEGLALEIATTSLCLRDSEGAVLSCYTPTPDELDPAKIAIEFQRRLFGIGVDLSKAQLSALMGASVVLRSQSYGSENALPNF